MGQIASAFAEAFRDFVTAGVPASGDNDPDKAEIRPIGALIETAISNVTLASLLDVTKSTRALLNADLAHGADTVALVYADSTDANNDLYVKVGGSGSGSWTLTTILHDIFDVLTANVVLAAESATAATLAALAAMDPDEAAVIAEVKTTSRGAAHKTEMGYLYKDRAGTDPVTAVGDLVGRIKPFVTGDPAANYDWVAPSDAARGQYFEAYGVGFVRMANAKAMTIDGVSMRVPSFMALGAAFAGTNGRTLMGFAKNTNTKFQINSATLGRMNSTAQGVSTDPVRALANALSPDFSAPVGPVAVYHALLGSDGVMDVQVEDSTVYSGGAAPGTVATAWADADTVTSMSLVLNGGSQAFGTGVPNSDASLDYYGGVILGTEPGNRDAIVRWLQSRTRPTITENDEVILVIGDSTGDNVSTVPDSIHEVFYRLAAEDLLTRRPDNGVILQDWSRVADTFQGMQRFTNGTRTRRTFVINCSSAGSQPGYFFGERFERAIGRLPNVALTIVNHGQNLAVGDPTILADTNRALLRAGEYIDMIDQIRGRFPTTKLIITKPYPYGVDGDERIEPVKKTVEYIATKYPDAIIADFYSVFDTGTGGDSRPAAWYQSDHVHPSDPTGIGKMYDVIVTAMNAYDALPSDLYITPPLIQHRRILPTENLLSNGTFETWSTGLPTSWALTGDGAVAKVGTAAQITATSAGGLAQTVNATALQGKNVVVTVTQNIDPGATFGSGGVRFSTNVGAIGDGRWVDAPYQTWGVERTYDFLFKVPASATTLTIEILGGGTGVGGTLGPGVTRVSRVVLVEGDDPRDILV